jgi:hypothetical protein
MSQTQDVIKVLAAMSRDDLLAELQRRLYADSARFGFDSTTRAMLALAYDLGRLAASKDWLDRVIESEIERVNKGRVQ